MKTPEQWEYELPYGIDTNYPYLRGIDYIRAIQADAFKAGAEAAAKVCDAWTEVPFALLHAGEMSAQELRTLVAVATCMARQIRKITPAPEIIHDPR